VIHTLRIPTVHRGRVFGLPVNEKTVTYLLLLQVRNSRRVHSKMYPIVQSERLSSTPLLHQFLSRGERPLIAAGCGIVSETTTTYMFRSTLGADWYLKPAFFCACSSADCSIWLFSPGLRFLVPLHKEWSAVLLRSLGTSVSRWIRPPSHVSRYLVGQASHSWALLRRASSHQTLTVFGPSEQQAPRRPLVPPPTQAQVIFLFRVWSQNRAKLGQYSRNALVHR
jgi:hypothetical protein